MMTTFNEGDNNITNQIFDSDWNEQASSLMLRPCDLYEGGAIHLGDNDAIMTDGTKLSVNSLLESVRHYLADKYVLPDNFTMTMPSYRELLEDELGLITNLQKM